MSLGKRHMVSKTAGRLLRLMVVVGALFVASPLASAQSSRSALLMNPKAYTGKRAWWYNYQFFPELTIFGQNEDTIPDVEHRFSFYLSGGRAGFIFKDAPSTANMKFGIGFGARYNYFLNKNWGFRTGLSYSYAASDASMGCFEDQFLKVDKESDDIIYDFRFSALYEDYKIHLIDIPIELVFQKGKVMSGLGIKLAMPVTVKYTQSVSELDTKAYFPQYDVWVDDSWVLGCGSYAASYSQNKFVASPIACLVTADVEYMLPINKKYSVGFGAYIDYSITSAVCFRKNHLEVVNTDQNSIVGTTTDVPAFLVTNSVMTGMRDFESEKVIPLIKYFNAGLKVSVNMNSYGPAKPKTNPY